MLMSRALVLVFSVLLVALVVCADADSVKKVSLPGMPAGYPGNVYAGYITVDASHQRQLFFMYFESLSNPKTDPVVLWNTGGPGCSSLLAAFAENGPFWPSDSGNSLVNAPYPWNKIANMIFVESPAGVGFSTSKVSADYVVGDRRTADDEYAFLQGFFNNFPSLRSLPFWITGESYGGHYVPNLASTIYHNNLNSTNPRINLAGFMVGNPWTDAYMDNRGCVDDWYGHAMIELETRNNMMQYCDFNIIGPLSEQSVDALSRSTVDDDKCDQATNMAMTQMGPIDIYDIYTDACNPRSETPATRLLRMLSETPRSPHRVPFQAKSKLSAPAPPCIDNYVTQYLNRADVQAALGVPSMKWVGCSDIVQYSRADLLTSMLPVYRDLIANANIKILVYSGDVDGIVPFEGTRAWIASLQLSETEIHRPWYVDEQVGGYVSKFRGLTYTTIRDAGHMVPATRPARAYYMFDKFLNGEDF